MASSVNTLIGNMSLLDQDGEYTLSDTNLISIDISDNRIGINTLDPSYSIHVKDTNDTSGIIYTTKLITQHLDSSNILINSSPIIFTILNGVLNISGIPNSSGGLNNGDIWRDVSGYLRIK